MSMFTSKSDLSLADLNRWGRSLASKTDSTWYMASQTVLAANYCYLFGKLTISEGLRKSDKDLWSQFGCESIQEQALVEFDAGKKLFSTIPDPIVLDIGSLGSCGGLVESCSIYKSHDTISCGT